MAYIFSEKLEKQFQYLTSHANDYQEVELFTKLEDSFLCLSKDFCGHIETKIIHGTRSHVKFDMASNWVGNKGSKETVELGDMFFVTYSSMNGLIRYFVLQNKNKNGKVKNRFKADLYQLDLLHHMSRFSGNGISNHLLQGSQEYSVAGYGVFEYKNNGKYDMNFYAAPCLDPYNSKGVSRNRMVKYAGPNSGERISLTSYVDKLKVEGLKNFGDALIKGEIGRVIDRKNRNSAFINKIQELTMDDQRLKKFNSVLQELGNKEEDIVREQYQDIDFRNLRSMIFIDLDEQCLTCWAEEYKG